MNVNNWAYGELDKVEDLSVLDDDVLYKARLSVYVAYRTNFVERLDCPVRFLDVYSGDDLSVLCGVAANPNTSGEVLEKLFELENSHIWERVAANPNTPVKVLKLLCDVQGEQSFLYWALLLNPNTPVRSLEWLFWESELWWTNLLRREKVSSVILVEVLKGEYPDVHVGMPRDWLWGLVEGSV